MIVLTLVAFAGSLVAFVLGAAQVRQVGRSVLVGELVMLVAMTDVHVPALRLVAAPFWAVLLGACAMATALVDRVCRPRRPQADHLHALGMLLGAVFVVLGDGHRDDAVGHHHTAALLVPLGVAVAVHVGAVVWSARRRGVPRAASVRRVAALVGVLAMGAMTIAH